MTDFGNDSTATFERTGQKSHLYTFPEDLCCLFHEPSQNIAIPASVNDDDDEDSLLALFSESRIETKRTNAAVLFANLLSQSYSIDV